MDMRAHVRLLEHLIRMWDRKQHLFQVGTHILTLYVEDIYFLTSLSMRVNSMSLFGSRGGEMTVYDLICEYFTIGTRYQGGKIPIEHVTDQPLRTFLFTIEKVEGSNASH